MLEDMEKKFRKKIESTYQNDSHETANFDNFTVPYFKFGKPNKTLRSRKAFYKLLNVD